MRQLKNQPCKVETCERIVYTAAEIKSAKVVLDRLVRMTGTTSSISSIRPVVATIREI